MLICRAPSPRASPGAPAEPALHRRASHPGGMPQPPFYQPPVGAGFISCAVTQLMRF